ncbi:hypothetical protein BDR26DRAFT_866012 [Obelidium mucronatum]|nr:hypothetical protein BDR26DRAFT_866012 [Obelidium mucronatum]
MDANRGRPMPVARAGGKPTPTPSKLHSIEKPSSAQILHHYERMRSFFKTYVLDDIVSFNNLCSDKTSEDVHVALCDAMSWLHYDTCLGCMNYRLQQSFLQRIIESTTDTSVHDAHQTVAPKKRDLSLSSDELLCLSKLSFAIPQNLDGLRPMLPYIAARMDPDDPPDYHNPDCRSLFEIRGTLFKMYQLMFDLSPGAVILEEDYGGRELLGDLSVYDNSRIEDVETSELQARHEREKAEEMLDNGSGDGDEKSGEDVSGTGNTWGAVDKSSQLLASDIILSRTREPLESILKMSPLDWVWTIQLADRAVGIFRKMRRKNLSAFVPVMKNIAMIANGQWTNSVACSLVADTKVVLYESKVLNNLRIVWQVEVAYLEINRMYSQVIRIQSIGNHKDVVDAVEYIQAAHKAYSSLHIDRCKQRSNGSGGGFVVPVTWTDAGDDKGHKVTFDFEGSSDPLSVLKMHEQAVTAKFIPLSKMMLCWLISDQNDKEDTEFPFSISEQEHEILQHTNSVIVIGRSGTGKTSCSIFRLLSHWHARMVDFNTHGAISKSLGINPSVYAAAAETKEQGDINGVRKLRFRQLFVTASPKFCGRVQSYYRNLSKSLNPGGNQKVLAEFIESMNLYDPAVGMADNETELGGVVNQNGELISFEEELSSPLHGGGLSSTSNDSSTTSFEGEEEYIQNLPKSFGDLKDADFPLFVHYKKFLSMVRVYLGLEEDTSFSEGDSAERNADFERFEEIFKSLDKKLTSGVEASAAFTEIMGVIKGHEAAATSPDGRLTRQQYVELSQRAYHSFSKNRDKLYDLFEAYNAKKLERFRAFVNGKLEFSEIPRKLDEQDRANEVNRAIAKMIDEKDPRLGKLMFNQVFLDEVQDLTMAQIMPLVTLCSDPEHGLMFAGDTAQVIHRGSVFRFEDLSSMIYTTLFPTKAISAAPKVFQLTKNYRSHDGILQVAASVLALLRKHFTGSIDTVAGEVGAIPGPQPVLVLQNNASDNIVSFLKGGKTDGEPIEFGAGQVILVRTLEEVAKVKKALDKDFALVMTVEQAKGMEFRDVVLMNLLTHSQGTDNHWRVFLADVEGNTEKYPPLEAEKHHFLATELKILYTAITRARSRLWIWDEDVAKRMPMFRLWESKKLVVTSDDERSGKFSASGLSPAEWYNQAGSLFEQGLYDDALISYERALRAQGKSEVSGDTLRCKAFIKREAARSLPKGREFKQLNFEAGELFKRAHAFEKLSQKDILLAARCYWDSDKFHESSAMYELVTQKQMDAVACFHKVSRFDLSGAALLKLDKPKEALQDFLKAPTCSLDALSTAKLLIQNNEVPDVATIEKVSAMVLSNHIISKREKVDAIEINQDVSVKKDLYRSHAMYPELANTFASQQDYEGAAKVMDLDAGSPLAAVRFYKEIGGTVGNVKGLDCLLKFFWNHVTPGLEALFKDDHNTLPSLMLASELGSSGLVLKTLNPVILMKGKLPRAVAVIVQNKWIEVLSVQQFIGTRRVTESLIGAQELSEMLLALKLSLAGRMMQHRNIQRVKVAAEIKSLLDLVETALQLIMVYRTFMAGLNSGRLSGVTAQFPTDGTSVMTRISELSNIGARDALYKQVEQVFYAFVGNAPNERICYKGVFERSSLSLESSNAEIRTDSAGRYVCSTGAFYSLAQSSMSFTILNICSSMVNSCLSSSGLGKLCLQGALINGKCPNSSCAYGHVVSNNTEFDNRKSSLLNYLVYLIGFSSGLIPVSQKDHFEVISGMAMKRFLGSLEHWDDGHCWTLSLAERRIPNDVWQFVFVYLKEKTLSMKELTRTSGEFDLDAVLGGAMLLSKEADFLSTRFKTSAQTLTAKGEVHSKYIRNMIENVHQCVRSATVVDFLSSATEILRESLDFGQNLFKITNLGAICNLIEILTVIFLLGSEKPFVLPWRVFQTGADKIKNLLNKPIETGVLKQFDSTKALVTRVVEAFRTADVDETQILRLAFARMLLVQQDHPASTKPMGTPSWISAPTFLKIVEKIASLGNNSLVFFYKDSFKTTEFVKNALDVAGKSLLLNSKEGRSLNELKAALKALNQKTVLASAQKATPAATPNASSSRPEKGTTSKKPKPSSANDDDDSNSMPSLESDSDNFYSASETPKKNTKGREKLEIATDVDDDDDIPALLSGSESGGDDAPDRPHTWYKAAVARNDPSALMHMADCYFNGTNGEKKDRKKAMELWIKADQLGVDSATLKLGEVYLNGKGKDIPKDAARAFKLFEKLSKKGNPEAECLVGQCLLGGAGVVRNVKRAKAALEPSAKKGFAGSQFWLGECCFIDGDGATNHQEAMHWFTQAANQGFPRALTKLGYCHQFGYGVAKNLELAAEYYKQALDKGETVAGVNLAEIYCDERDYEKAFPLFEKAAQAGIPLAQKRLGDLYLKWKKDDASAITWYKKAAEKGSKEAQQALGAIRDGESEEMPGLVSSESSDDADSSNKKPTSKKGAPIRKTPLEKSNSSPASKPLPQDSDSDGPPPLMASSSEDESTVPKKVPEKVSKSPAVKKQSASSKRVGTSRGDMPGLVNSTDDEKEVPFLKPGFLQTKGKPAKKPFESSSSKKAVDDEESSDSSLDVTKSHQKPSVTRKRRPR